jgi:hypothetical protein
MRIDFKIGDMPCSYVRDPMVGWERLEYGGRRKTLQNPLSPLTWFGFNSKRTREVEIEGHLVTIEKSWPVLMGGLRPRQCRILVDGVEVGDQDGF